MTAILSKPTDQIDAADIRSLVTSRVPEGERIEFKRELPATGTSNRDPWMLGKMKVSRYAKDQILKEVVSFANAYGGVLVLGIEEDESATPPAAKDIRAIPRCEELAERFRIIFRDRVEPKLPSCDVVPVVTSGAEGGVVVFRVPGRSRLAPHRIKGTWICPVRRSDRSEEMSMREIQDLTLNVTRGLERLDKRMQVRAELFEREFERLTVPDGAYGIRITATPVGDDIRLPKICRPYFDLVDGLNPPSVTVRRHVPGQDAVIVRGLGDILRVGHYNWRPRLRAARSDANTDPPDLEYHTYIELHCDGLVEFGSLVGTNDGAKNWLYSDYVVRELANAICWTDTLRRYADAGRAEYAVQVAMHLAGEKVVVLPGPNGDWPGRSQSAGQLSRGVTMPIYTLDDVADAPALLSSFEHDLCNAGGTAFADDTLGEFEIAYESG